MNKAYGRFWTAVMVCGAVSAAAGNDAEIFKDYYASASTLITTLNALAGELERLDVARTPPPPEKAADLQARLVKAREGFAEIITFNERTEELNEGYILYLDQALLALLIAGEYYEQGGAEKLARAEKLLADSGALRARLDAQLRADKKKFGTE